jgi:hypothetical protein
MKISPKTAGAYAVLDLPTAGKCNVVFYTATSRDQVGVIEFPKVWRTGGKQYRVAHCLYRNWGNPVSVIIKVPEEAQYKVVDADYKVEKY